MKVPLSLLLQYCDPGLDADAIASVLALTGTEVERVRQLGPSDTEGFVVGRVVECVQHPDADRLRVCTVDVGAEQPATIVCGAPNVASGQLVAVALPGAVMPGGMKIKRAKLRGVESQGMICSEAELELGSGSDGILVLPEGEAGPGSPLAAAVPLRETVLDLEITPNRPDCLGVWGVARELHAATGAPLADPPWAEDLGSPGAIDGVSITVDCPDLCSRFTARVFDGLTEARTPIEIRAHLHSAGMRAISPIVDITNYVMLVTGEPMHAFDLDRIAGSALTVRVAEQGESVDTLDGEARALLDGELLIADAEGPTSIAGVMGGARSEVSAATSRVLLEAAVWDGPTIHSMSARLGLRSEASGRFEKGLGPVYAGRAQAYASVLFERIFGVRPLAGTVDTAPAPLDRPALLLPHGMVEGLLGFPLPEADMVESLVRLGFEVGIGPDGLEAVPPPDRPDVSRPIDVVEELARIAGLDSIPATLPSGGSGGGLTAAQRTRRRLSDSVAAEGFFEVAGWSFTRPGVFDSLLLPGDHHMRDSIAVENPMSEEESIMRTTLLGSLLDSAARNHQRGAESIRLFEIGPVYIPGEAQATGREPLRLGGVMAGPARRPGWRDQSPPTVDFFSGSGALAAALSRVGVEIRAERSGHPEPFLHPGRCAVVRSGDHALGWLGELHPTVAANWGLPGAVAFELDLAAIETASPGVPAYSGISSHPAVRQDIAVTVDSDRASGELVAIARETGGPELESVEVFDLYSGDQVGEGKVSIGLRLSFRAADRTLTEDEATAARSAVTAALTERLGGEVRG